jgi:hypothetical protein
VQSGENQSMFQKNTSPPPFRVDELLWRFNDYIIGYADDITILINVKFAQTMSEMVQTALDIVQQWYGKTDLSTSIRQ